MTYNRWRKIIPSELVLWRVKLERLRFFRGFSDTSSPKFGLSGECRPHSPAGSAVPGKRCRAFSRLWGLIRCVCEKSFLPRINSLEKFADCRCEFFEFVLAMSGIFLILIFLPLKSYANFIIGNFDYISGRFKKVADYMKNSPTLALLFQRIRSAKAIRSGFFGVRCSTRATTSTSRPEVFVESRCARNRFGNKSIDDGNYLFTLDEMKDFVAREPAAAKYFRLWYGAREFINNEPRYCLWPGYCPSNELRKRSLVYRRVKTVRDFSVGRQKRGHLRRKFSERRRYIPLVFMGKNEIFSDASIFPWSQPRRQLSDKKSNGRRSRFWTCGRSIPR